MRIGRTGNRGWYTLAGHIVGIAGLLWSIGTWVEWFAIPAIYPVRSGPLPYIDFAPQAIILGIGCILFWWIDLELPLTWKARLLYVCGPSSYLLYQVWTIIPGLVR